MIPPVWKWLQQLGGFVLAAVVIFSIGYGAGYGHARAAYKVQLARLQLEAAKAALRQQKAQESVSDASASRAATAEVKERVVTHTIIQKVPAYVNQDSDAQCTVPVGFVSLHNAAASGDVSGLSAAPGGADAAPSGLKLSAVALTVADNYGTCRETAQRLTILQDWVRAQAEISRPVQ